jgi:hydroxymethylbilane synthase
VRLGTRGSELALAQARWVAERLDAPVELVTVTTSGDRGRAGEDKSRWVKELEHALLDERIDLAVHSAKDVPSELPGGLELLGVPERAEPRDVLCGASTLAELRPGAPVGTSSVRRRAQLLAAREDLDVSELRGNVDTRLRRLDEGGYDAMVLAGAGLARLGRTDVAGALLETIPAPGQGTLVLEGRTDHEAARAAAAGVTNASAERALRAERTLVRFLDASCHTPLGALAQPCDAETIQLAAWIGLPDGSAWLADELEGSDPEALGLEVGRRLELAGARELLDTAERAATG